jgi:hypothetical protein
MKKEKYAISECYKIFSDFINEKIDTETMLFKLNNIELEIKAEYKYSTLYKNLWFKFYKDDTAATTIRDIQLELQSTMCNQEHMIDKMEIAVNEKSLKIFFS